MRVRTLAGSAVMIVLILGAALAADINGKWKAEYESPDGQKRESTFILKVDGAKLTGSVVGGMGEVPIQDGKVSGDDLSFFVIRNFGGNDVKLAYKGKAAANEIKFTVTFGDGERTFDIVAKRQ